MEKTEIVKIKEQIQKQHKVVVEEYQNKLIVSVPKHLGFDNKKDKIEYVEDLMKAIVDNIRQHKQVFDVECDITYEFIKITFIG